MKEKEEDNRKREIIISVVAILVLIVAVVGVTYAAFTFTQGGSKENTISTGTITFNYSEKTNGISLVNAQPLDDSVGKVLTESDPTKGVEQGYFDFTVASTVTGSTSINYEVYGVEEASNTLDAQYVKVYLTDASTDTALTGYTETVPTYNSLTDSTSAENAKVLYKGAFNGTDSKDFRLRIWVADAYEVTNTSTAFTMKVNVNATA